MGFVHLIPQRARQRILDIAATLMQDGSAYHQYQPLTKKGNTDVGSGFNDDPLWLISVSLHMSKKPEISPYWMKIVAYDCDMSVADSMMSPPEKML